MRDIARYRSLPWAKPELAEVLSGWVSTWAPRADASVSGLALLFETAPVPMESDAVVITVTAQRAEQLAEIGL